MHEQEHCHSGPMSCCTTCLDIFAICFPSFASKHRKRIFHSPSILVEQIPYAWCLQCQTSATFSFMVLVKGRQECSSSLTDIHPFLKCLNHSWVCVWPRALSPNASLSILCGFQSCLAEFEAEFGANPLLLHISHFSKSVGSQKALPWRHKNAQKKHTSSQQKVAWQTGS